MPDLTKKKTTKIVSAGKTITGDQKKEKTVATPSDAHKEQMKRLNLIHTILRGVKAVVANPEYFPMDAGEDEKGYNARKRRSHLLNVVGRTIEKLTGEVFSIPVDFSEKTRPELVEWGKDVDRKGTDLNRFCRKVFSVGVRDGITFLLPDYPSPEIINEDGLLYYIERFDGNGAEEKEEVSQRRPPEKRLFTEGVQKEMGLNAYLTHIEVKNLIGGKWVFEKGALRFTQIRIREFVEEDESEFHTRTVEQIRVLYEGRWEVYRIDEEQTKASGKEEWVLKDSGTTSFSEIPLVVIIFGDEETPLTSIPPLEGLGELNLAHFQSSSDQRNILHFARLAIFFGKGLDVVDKQTGAKKKLVWGGNRLVHGSKEWSDLKAVEFAGSAVKVGEDDCNNLKKDMSMFGLTFLMPKAGGTTATEKVIDKSEVTSPIESMANIFQAAMNQVIENVKFLLAIEPGEETGSVIVNHDFSTTMTTAIATLLLDAADKGKLPEEVFLEEWKRLGIIGDDWDIPAIQKMLADQKVKSMSILGDLQSFDTGGDEEDKDKKKPKDEKSKKEDGEE